MSTEELSEKSDLRSMQREQERERRRMRDRERRQSMSHEEREKHLARRRRNYQLRRQRVETAQSDPQREQTSIATEGEQNTRNVHQAVINVSELDVQSDSVAHVGFNQGLEKLNAAGTKFEGLEARAQLVEFPRRLRLNHIRNLARSLKDPVGELSGDNNQHGADVITMENASTNCRSPKRLRLNHVKRLARALNSTMKEATGQNHRNETEVEQNLAQGEIQPISGDVSKFAQSNNVKGEDE